MTRLVVIVTLAIAFSGATQSRAESFARMIGDAYRIEVADLDLTKPDDGQELLRRVDWASRRICRNDIVKVRRVHCAQEARDRALASLGARERLAITSAGNAWPPGSP